MILSIQAEAVDQVVDQRYASDLSDTEWEIIEPLIAQAAGSGRRRTVPMREVVNALFYRIKTGCQWRMLPKEFPHWGHVTYYYYTWRNTGLLEQMNTIMYQTVRVTAGCHPEPSVAILDSQDVKATAMGGERGFDPNKKVKGRKRTILVDKLGLILFAVVCGAQLPDTTIGTYVAYEAHQRFARMKTVLADRGYESEALLQLFRTLWSCTLRISPRRQETRAFTPEPQRWKVERTLAWLGWSRILNSEYERTTESSEANMYLASIRMMLRKLIKGN